MRWHRESMGEAMKDLTIHWLTYALESAELVGGYER
jgi:hypothetical protein